MKTFSALSLFLPVSTGVRVVQRHAEAPYDEYFNRRITCPVLAALNRAGQLPTDDDGNVEIRDIFTGLHEGLGIDRDLSLFQAFGIVGFPKSQLNKELVRDRCIPRVTESGNKCFMERFMAQFPSKQQEVPVGEDTLRFLNILKMNGKQSVEHGVSTGVRGGGTDMPNGLIEQCNGQFPCEPMFQKFYVSVAEPNGRMYTENLLASVCLMRQVGDRGGENSHRGGQMSIPLVDGLLVTASEWQAKGALTAMLQVFGTWDAARGERYMTAEDVRSVVMDGKFPEGWTKREHGCINEGCDYEERATTRWRKEIKNCPAVEFGEFWQNSACQTRTGTTCGSDSDCANVGAHCMDGHCTCSRGDNGKTKCFKRGKCRQRNQHGCDWFGSDCEIVKTSNPDAPGN